MGRALVFLLVWWAGVAQAETPPDQRASLAQGLRTLEAQLSRGQARISLDGALGQEEFTAALASAQFAFIEEDYPEAALMLLELMARPGAQAHPGAAEALAWLGESLAALGLSEAATASLGQALAQPHQLPSAYRARLARYLELAGDRLKVTEARAHWARYRATRTPGPLDEADREIRYRYAKALYFADALGEAEVLFGAIDPDDPFYARARYFLGVLALKRDQLNDARARFEEGLTVSRRPSPTDEAPTLTLPTEAEANAGHVADLTWLALARLSAIERKDAEAWQLYRAIAPGSPEYAVALSEATFVLFRQRHFGWCARLIDQLLAMRGDDVSAAQLSLWQAQLLARSEDFEEARARYEALSRSLEARARELEAAITDDTRLFPEAVLAWSAPGDARQARALEAELIVQEEALAESQEAVEALLLATRSPEPLPVVALGLAQAALLGERLKGLSEAIDELGDEALASEAGRLRGQIAQYIEALHAFDGRYRVQIERVVAAEAEPLRAQGQALAALRASVARLSLAMRATARGHVESYQAETLFGQVDIAWWRKEAVTERIRALLKARQDALNALSPWEE